MGIASVAIMTLFYKNYNYGGILQAYALQKIIEKNGHNCTVINLNRNNRVGVGAIVKNTFYKGRRLLLHFEEHYASKIIKEKRIAFDEFITDNVKSSSKVYTQKTISEIVDDYDIFICGSDQVWSPVSGRPATFLSFVPENKYKIAYAASIGADFISDEYRKKISPWIKRLNAVSVREENAKLLADSILNEPGCSLVLDPTLLLDSGEWHKISKPVKDLMPNRYDLLYFLGESDDAWNEAYRCSVMDNSMTVNLPYNKMKFCKRDYDNTKINLRRIGPAEFIWLIENAKHIYTDSFHGTVFSIIFQKEFYVYERAVENDNGSMNGRIGSLLNMLGISRELVTYKKVRKNRIDYSEVQRKLERYKKYSLEFLRNALYEG